MRQEELTTKVKRCKRVTNIGKTAKGKQQRANKEELTTKGKQQRGLR
jgi:hypothetical protein